MSAPTSSIVTIMLMAMLQEPVQPNNSTAQRQQKNKTLVQKPQYFERKNVKGYRNQHR